MFRIFTFSVLELILLYFKFVHGYEEEVKKLLGDFNNNLTQILMIASLDSRDVQFLLSENQPRGNISYDEVIVALIQVLPI